MLSLLKDLLLLQERKGVLFAGSKSFDLFGFVFPVSEFPVNGAGCFPHLPLIHFKSLFSLSVCCTPNFSIGLDSVAFPTFRICRAFASCPSVSSFYQPRKKTVLDMIERRQA